MYSVSGFKKFQFRGIFVRILPSTAAQRDLAAPKQVRYGLRLSLNLLSTRLSRRLSSWPCLPPGESTTETRSSPLESETKTDLAATARKSPKNLVKSAGKSYSCPLTTDQETETQNVSVPYLRFHNQFEMVGRILKKKKKIVPDSPSSRNCHHLLSTYYVPRTSLALCHLILSNPMRRGFALPCFRDYS